MRTFLLATLALAACERSQAPRPDENAQTARPAAQAPSMAARTVSFSPAPAGEPVEAAVLREREAASRDGQRLVVYVGATWCEPCQRFHRAAEEGLIEGKLPPVRFLEFDLDRDSERLKAAGYRSRYIPLFAIPDEAGKASGKQIEGGVKGERAPAELTGRLQGLLAQSP